MHWKNVFLWILFNHIYNYFNIARTLTHFMYVCVWRKWIPRVRFSDWASLPLLRDTLLPLSLPSNLYFPTILPLPSTRYPLRKSHLPIGQHVSNSFLLLVSLRHTELWLVKTKDSRVIIGWWSMILCHA